MTNPKATITATQNGQTITIAEILFPDLSSLTQITAEISQVISKALTYPIEVDAGTAINLVLANTAGVMACSANVDLRTETNL